MSGSNFNAVRKSVGEGDQLNNEIVDPDDVHGSYNCASKREVAPENNH